jgi:hypothetical protein
MRLFYSLLLMLVCFGAGSPEAAARPVQQAPSFTVELVGFPNAIDRGAAIEGRVRITNLGDRRQKYSVQTYVVTPYGPAALLTRSSTSIPANDSGVVDWIITTGGLEPGEYEVRIGVKRGKEYVFVPLHFTVQ